ncbi:kinase-like domain-containing protein [Irpex rosettiformis]|uniref:Kinase-like domain-containing protein n=1 Tax=Irpex rosettiformis TaxID=378272 RepID=A0ACB8TSQ8_9APHY|nr:kinase-like domain-containing protein [Irpex rosettiformis]
MAHDRMSAKDASYVFSQLVDAVDHLHSKGFVHCDIKPGNILIDADLKIKLIDFGNMIELPMDWDPREGPVIYDPYDGILGTRLYTPTEMICNDPYIPQGLDVWAMGVTLFQMVTGYRPFRDENSIKKHIINYDLEQLENTAALTKMWPILCRCLEPDPLERITIQSLKEVDGIRPFPVWKVDLSKEEVRMMHRRV